MFYFEVVSPDMRRNEADVARADQIFEYDGAWFDLNSGSRRDLYYKAQKNPKNVSTHYGGASVDRDLENQLEHAVADKIKSLSHLGGGTHEGVVTLRGRITFKNTDGYLSADYRYEYRVYFFLGLYYGALCWAWLGLYLTSKEKMISVTKGLAGIYILGFLECLFSWIYFLDQDSSGS